MASSVRKIGILAKSCKQLITLLEQKLPVTKYHISEIHFEESHLLNTTNTEVSNKAKENVVQQIENVEILIADPFFMQPIMYDLKKLKWCQATWAGVDCMTKNMKEDVNDPQFLLTRYGSVFGEHLSEYVVSNIINFERRAFQSYDAQKQNLWIKATPDSTYRLLSELSICILGIGDIGRVVAKNCKDFGMTVYGMVSKVPGEKQQDIDEYFISRDLPKYLEKCDYVCNILPITSDTDNMLSGGKLKHCAKNKSVFINIGRGNVISEDEILEALENKWIGGAILDVFRQEPLPKYNKLWQSPNVVITPHISGLTLDHHLVEFFLKQLKRYENNEEVEFIVNWNRGY